MGLFNLEHKINPAQADKIIDSIEGLKNAIGKINIRHTLDKPSVDASVKRIEEALLKARKVEASSLIAPSMILGGSLAVGQGIGQYLARPFKEETPKGPESRMRKKAFWSGFEKAARELTYKARENLPDSAFVFPGKRKYPIHDKAHARNALARVSQFGSSSEQKAVRAAVHSKYPDIGE